MAKNTRSVKPNHTRFPLLLVPLLIVGALGVLFLTTRKNTHALGCCPNPEERTGEYETDNSVAFFQGHKIESPKEEDIEPVKAVLGEDTGEERWIEVDISDQKLIAREGDTIYLETSVSTGLPWTPTPIGEFRIWGKFKYTKMEGGTGKYYYYLPNVPYVMFFENKDIPGRLGYGLHGTYWHNDFGTRRSHGCVNLPTPVAKKLFYWTNPVVPQEKTIARTNEDNLGTRIVIHE